MREANQENKSEDSVELARSTDAHARPVEYTEFSIYRKMLQTAEDTTKKQAGTSAGPSAARLPSALGHRSLLCLTISMRIRHLVVLCNPRCTSSARARHCRAASSGPQCSRGTHQTQTRSRCGLYFLANVVFKDGVSHGHGQPVHDFVDM